MHFTFHREAAIFITPFKIKNSDLGTVIVGGRIDIGRTTEDSFTRLVELCLQNNESIVCLRKRRGAREENEEHLVCVLIARAQ